MASNEFYGVHLLAGGIGGTVGAILTCPLEVVKTRLQSSIATFNSSNHSLSRLPIFHPNLQAVQTVNFSTCTNACTNVEAGLQHATRRSLGLIFCLRHIIQTEGVHALFKGLGPNLIGVAPARAIYFFTYANMKKYFNSKMNPETPLVHICSAVSAGITASTATNPIWFIKTRLQLDQKRNNSLTCKQCVKQVYSTNGIQGFYKGITASYFGVSETVIHFVIYEAVKAKLLKNSNHDRQHGHSTNYHLIDFLKFMLAAAISKTCATCIAYPHEVARTRLREEGNKYHSFIQTILLVAKEEGPKGLYRGLATQLVRQIPNTAVMMSTYEAIVHLCTR